MGELQAIEKILKKPLPVLGGAPWAADMIAAAPKPQRNRGGGRPQGQKPQGANPHGPRPQGQPAKPGGGGAQRGPKPPARGGGMAPRRSGGSGKPGGGRRPG